MGRPGEKTYPPVGPRKYRLSYVLMTREQAMDIRSAHVQGKPVLALELQEAIRVLRKRPEPRRLRLPELSRPEKERINAVLVYNLGLAIGRLRKEAA